MGERGRAKARCGGVSTARWVAAADPRLAACRFFVVAAIRPDAARGSMPSRGVGAERCCVESDPPRSAQAAPGRTVRRSGERDCLPRPPNSWAGRGLARARHRWESQESSASCAPISCGRERAGWGKYFGLRSLRLACDTLPWFPASSILMQPDQTIRIAENCEGRARESAAQSGIFRV